jgi:hypothetical protein
VVDNTANWVYNVLSMLLNLMASSFIFNLYGEVNNGKFS